MRISDFAKVEPLEKGWSGDIKNIVTDKDGRRYLLRIAPEKKSAAAEEAFRIMKHAEAVGVAVSRPVDMGKCAEGIYQLLEWVDGQDAEAIMPSLDERQAYTHGLTAGRYLRAIHSLPAPDGCEDWAERFGRKMDRKIAMYSECPVKYEDGQLFLDYIAENRHLIAHRPQTMQHGDYHVGNMLVDSGGRLVIIDFDRCDYGDPWEEFNRIVWCAQVSPAFASGRVDGYFPDGVPEDFWRLLLLYICSNTISSLPWALPFGQKELGVMVAQAEEILGWYGRMSRIVPTWYRSIE